MKTNKEYNFRVGDYVEAGTFLDAGYITKITRQLFGNDSDIFYHIEADLHS